MVMKSPIFDTLKEKMITTEHIKSLQERLEGLRRYL